MYITKEDDTTIRSLYVITLNDRDHWSGSGTCMDISSATFKRLVPGTIVQTVKYRWRNLPQDETQTQNGPTLRPAVVEILTPAFGVVVSVSPQSVRSACYAMIIWSGDPYK